MKLFTLMRLHSAKFNWITINRKMADLQSLNFISMPEIG